MSTANTNRLTLNQLRAGTCAVVQTVDSTNKKLLQKLLTMGVVAGTAVEVLCVAPLGDPIEIRALGYKLSLRKAEASCVAVELASKTSQILKS